MTLMRTGGHPVRTEYSNDGASWTSVKAPQKNSEPQLFSELESITFWFEELLDLAREINSDLMRFYSPEKGWPPHIQGLIGPTDYDTILSRTKGVLSEFEREKSQCP